MFETILGAASGGLLPALGALGGAVMRWVAARQQQAAERDKMAHELAMLEATAKIEDRRAEQRLAEMSRASEIQLAAIRAKGEADTQVEEQRALGLALQAQLAPSGNPRIDALNASVRPILTYWWCMVLYTVGKGLLVIALFADGRAPDAKTAASILMTDFDQAIVGSMLGFWFVDRALRKGR